MHKYIPTTLLSTDFQTGSSFLKKPSLSAPAVLFAPQSLDAKGNDFVVAEVYAVYLKILQYGLSGFQAGDTKLEIFLPKNQYTQRK